jgi:hypothetical protein
MYLKTTSKSDEEETPHVQITEISIYAPYGLLLGHRCGLQQPKSIPSL